MHKSGFVTIIGRPNVGKSTLLNYIMGEKLSIVSCKPQTTRNSIRTILTKKDYQIIFVDTPGIHKPRHKLGEYMVQSAVESTEDVDLIIFMTTPSEAMGKGDKLILDEIKGSKVPVFLVVNKIDETPEDEVAKSLAEFSKEFNFKEIIPISAANGKNCNALIDLMVDNLEEGPCYYPEDMITDRQERFVVGEIIREKALKLLTDEVPHGTAVEVISMKQDTKGNYEIDADLLCEKESHKGIIIGKNGSMLKKIKTYSRQDIEKFLSSKVKLNIWVKVKKEWRDSNFLLKELGYKKSK